MSFTESSVVCDKQRRKYVVILTQVSTVTLTTVTLTSMFVLGVFKKWKSSCQNIYVWNVISVFTSEPLS